MLKPFVSTIVLTSTLALAACGGGGGGTSGGGGIPSVPTPTNTPVTVSTPTPTPSPTPVPTVAPASLAGKVVDRGSSTPLTGFTVTVGSVPNNQTCNGAQTQTLNVCANVATTVATATTIADGTFSIPTLTPGSYMIIVGKDGTYATLHRTFTVAAGVNTLGTVSLTALSTTQQNWLADYNNQRATVSLPVSFGNMIVDEYAQEEAQRWADDVAAGATVYSDSAYGPYQLAYQQQHAGSMYGATGVLAVTGPAFPGGVIQNDSGWMSEKTDMNSCNQAPYNQSWQTCPHNLGGHYINISNTQDVWVGLAESALQFYFNGIAAGYPTDVMIIQNTGSLGPASVNRVAVSALRKP